MSSRPYLATPARSAWPGRGRVTGARCAPRASARRLGRRRASCAASSPSRDSRSSSRSVRRSSRRRGRRRGSRRGRTRSPSGGRGRSRPAGGADRGDRVEVDRKPGGMPSRMTTSARPCDSPAVRNRTICIRRNCSAPALRGEISSNSRGSCSCTMCAAAPPPCCSPIDFCIMARGLDRSGDRRRRARRLRDRRRAAEQIDWAERCAMLAVLRHPAVEPAHRLRRPGSARCSKSTSARPLPHSAARLSTVLTHAVRFLQAHGIELPSRVASLRSLATSRSSANAAEQPMVSSCSRARAIEWLDEGARRGGPAAPRRSCELRGAGMGLRTLATLLARRARSKATCRVCPDALERWPSLTDALLEGAMSVCSSR